MVKVSGMFLFLFLAFGAAAQRARFEFLTTADGLAGNNTSSVAQDETSTISKAVFTPTSPMNSAHR